MEMMIKKIVLKKGLKDELLNSLLKLNDTMRLASGFISAILLDSKVDKNSIYLFSMWMDNDSLLAFEKTFNNKKISFESYCESISSEPLDVLLSITTEGDFKPVVN
ncbi:MAG: hypothetical protein COB02_14100 [Candidatus Cloacimonadota bacterium]|nr:MAG: hypothetical protein COB02_14100 [Candidatus Cloacimonadota bacterium]